ncbi:hypothetical protein SU69_00880 [Thermosipho melanesiensis]|uniref:UvrB/UvrC protein n=2 Tax=Thermosipho melanesiensis TaxID=46541 RepID=A6LJE0_THEM4|nr:hypothetical protein [Thermosipho melanesiensis]ABR30041.1 hypothetical protein Tmel_0164 [Thermosipho melanesiensis BI429]APT73242.1 hypothetical protein BW47_00905 [Thermosipho melanesiensis]OOC38635.1 hypothetical protein SU68_00880 [Thermosipho melanesiensis]OOC40439.1 hypothetical protein SU70_00880 [Thermosipho melanesiensis]OOC40704.1 hypothetical protein SU69_00880 [Thermosipho melanesiensis]
MKKCSRCGKNADIFLVVDVDIAKKEIVLCKRCLKETLKFDTVRFTKAGVELLSAHMEFAEEITLNSTRFIANNLEILTLMPLAVQSALFEHDSFTKKRMINDIQKRQVYFLKQKLIKALEKEQYDIAKKIKEQIDNLEKQK